VTARHAGSGTAAGHAAAGGTARHAFPQLDGLRALAAFGVVLTHTAFLTGRTADDGPFAPILARLNFGVTLFFLLSGFLLYRPFVAAALAGRPRPALRRFWVRRALRIFPAYWLALAVLLAFAATSRFSPGDVLAYATLTHTYVGAPEDGALTQMWTLVVEVAFYLVLPLLALASLPRGREPMALLRRQAVLLVGMVAVTIGYVPAVRAIWPRQPQMLLWLPAYLDWFALGMALAIASCVLGSPELTARCRLGVLSRLADDGATCWIVGGLLLWTASLPLAGPLTLVPPTGWERAAQHALFGAAAAFLMLPCVLGTHDRGRIRAFLGAAPMRRLGTVSYGVYLWHLGLIVLTFRLLDQQLFSGGFWRLLGIVAVASVAVATASYELLERPLLSRGRTRPARATAQHS